MADLPDYVQGPQDLAAYKQGYRLDERHPDHVRQWMSDHLCHFQDRWAGEPFVLLDWQYDQVIRPLYGWVRDGIRRFRYLYLWVGVKNGKTSLMAAICLYQLVADTRGALVVTAAYDQKQATICHDACIQMGVRSPALAPHLRMNRALHEIHLDADAGCIKAVSSDANRAQGLNASTIGADEIHTWRGFDFWGVLDERTKARSQPLFLHTSTAGVYDPEGFGWSTYDRCRKILAGQVEDIRSLVVLHEADPAADITDPAAHRAANPSLGVTIDADRMMEEAVAAKTSRDVQTINKFRRYSLNQWVESATGWIASEDWKACADGVPLDPGLDYYGGLDLASHDDMSAFALVAEDGDRIRSWVWYWAPQVGAAKRQAEGVKLLSWADGGYCFLVPGEMIDPAAIQDFVVNLCQTYMVQSIGFDPYQALQLATTMINVHGLPMVSCPQSPRHYNEPCMSLESLIKSRRFAHQDHPVLNWNVSNATLKEDTAGHVMPVKSGKSKKIDGLACILMALGRLLFSGACPVNIR